MLRWLKRKVRPRHATSDGQEALRRAAVTRVHHIGLVSRARADHHARIERERMEAIPR